MRCAVITGHWPPQRNTALTRAHITVTCGELWPGTELRVSRTWQAEISFIVSKAVAEGRYHETLLSAKQTKLTAEDGSVAHPRATNKPLSHCTLLPPLSPTSLSLSHLPRPGQTCAVCTLL
jgi:hypothetical protein